MLLGRVKKRWCFGLPGSDTTRAARKILMSPLISRGFVLKNGNTPSRTVVLERHVMETWYDTYCRNINMIGLWCTNLTVKSQRFILATGLWLTNHCHSMAQSDRQGWLWLISLSAGGAYWMKPMVEWISPLPHFLHLTANQTVVVLVLRPVKLWKRWEEADYSARLGLFIASIHT